MQAWPLAARSLPSGLEASAEGLVMMPGIPSPSATSPGAEPGRTAPKSRTKSQQSPTLSDLHRQCEAIFAGKTHSKRRQPMSKYAKYGLHPEGQGFESP